MNYKLIISYDGSNFYGWQRLNRKRTVQGELEKILKKTTGQKIEVIGAGRTDAKAHGVGQVANFSADIGIPINKMKHVLNQNLPSDIAITSIDQVPEKFHARYSALGKRYCYKIYHSKKKDVFLSKYYYQIDYALNYDGIELAAKEFVGTKDFRSFAVKTKDKQNTVRQIHAIELKINEPFIEISISGNGFLYKMVRTIVGNLLAVGRGQLSVGRIEEIFEAKDRRKAKATAPAHGLYLEEVFY